MTTPQTRASTIRFAGALVVGAAALVIGIWLVVRFVRPTPPRVVTMATGAPDSAYQEFGVRYRALLARHGVELRLVTTDGDVDNLARLTDASSEVSVSFLCSGTTSEQRTPELVALGTVGYAPLWVFYRGEVSAPVDLLNGKRVSIGPEGSGTRKLGLELLASAGLDLRTATVLGLTQQAAADAMQKGELDVALMLAPWEADAVRRLLASPDVNVLSYPRADAHVALRPFLHRLVLPRGVADLEHDRPPTDVVLVAPKVSLVARADLHPAVQYLLLDAATQIHGQPAMFQQSAQFPAAEPIDLPLSDHARQYYHSGTPFLQRYLPFWIASIASQLLLLLLPLIGIAYPLARVLPTLIGWSVRRPIFALYGDLKRIENELTDRADGESVADLSAALTELEVIANHKRVPLAFTPLLYTLRHHIELVQARLEKRSGRR